MAIPIQFLAVHTSGRYRIFWASIGHLELQMSKNVYSKLQQGLPAGWSVDYQTPIRVGDM